MSEARILIVEGAGLAHASLLRRLWEQEAAHRAKVIELAEQTYELRILGEDELLAEIEQQFTQAIGRPELVIVGGRAHGKSWNFSGLEVEPPLYQEPRKRAQWKEETNRHRGRRR